MIVITLKSEINTQIFPSLLLQNTDITLTHQQVFMYVLSMLLVIEKEDQGVCCYLMSARL